MKDDSSAWADEVLRRVRASADPQPLDQARVLSAVERRLDMLGSRELPEPPVLPGASTRGAPELPRGVGGAGSLSSTLARWGRGVTFGLATGALGYWWGSSTRDSGADVHARVVSAPSSVTAQPLAPAPVPQPTLKTLQPSPTPVTAEPAAVVSAATPLPRARPTRSASARAKPASLRAQAGAGKTEALTLREALEILQRAQTALHIGAARDALASLSELERRGAGPLLREERLVTRSLALCELGEIALARGARQELERQEPQSIYRGRLEASCASSDKE